MPNIKSAKKRVKTSRVRRLRNASVKSSLKTSIRRFNEALLTESENGGAQVQLNAAYSVIDRAARKGIIHKNEAARRKSRLTKKLNKLSV